MSHSNLFKTYLDTLAKRQPSPGGGSVVCLMFCQGVSLLEKAVHYSQSSKPQTASLTQKHRRLQVYSRVLFRLRRKIYPFIDRDGYIFEKIMRSRGACRLRYIKQSQKLIITVAEACCEVFSLAKKMESDIKKNIISDFYIGRECVKLALKGCIVNLKANEELFGVKEKSLKTYQNLQKRWR